MADQFTLSYIANVSTGTIGSPDVLLSANQIDLFQNTTRFYLAEVSQNYTSSSMRLDNNPAPWDEIVSIIP
jgi:hypothetical protein